MILAGVDTGGTFTDLVVLQEGELRVHKVLSTPAAPERAILQGLQELGVDPDRLRLVHGSTVATNAVLEGKGAATLYITNRGLADVLQIGRQHREDLYDLNPAPPPPLIPPERCLETGGRRDADGRLLEPLTEADLERLRAAVAASGCEAAAVNLLFSWRDDTEERRIEQALRDLVQVSRSSEVLPEIREYERGVATCLNALVGPRVQGYLERLTAALEPAPVAVMQSAGGTVQARDAARRGVHLLLSGPAGGLHGVRFIGRLAACPRLMTFDMGGTSTDVALVAGEPALTTEGRIGRWPVAVPMVDMHTIGAGGGSLGWIDPGGLLQVGPRSAGADPGPACYGRGGRAPTVTDAHLALGHLQAAHFLGGAMRLDRAAALRALAGLGAEIGLDPLQTAAGMLRIADEHMAQALRVISVQRGHDPAEFVLASFGGAGGLHVCALAEHLGMRRALVPVHAGVLSALGMLTAPPARELSQSLQQGLETLPATAIEAAYRALEARGCRMLAAEGVPREALRIERRADLRYAGQSHTLTLPWPGTPAQARRAFDAAHRQRYGHALGLPVEVVNLRVRVSGPDPELRLPSWRQGPPAAPREHVSVHGLRAPVPLYARAELAAGQRLQGPALVTETVATTWIAPGWRAEVDAWGNLLLEA
ncbi:MAG: hydantoinase/oxoprolinase family protein [Gammaproteobacteria bacterium]|nr:MAG: hydantoinase/oxoprolinase family protein [Gammaproteobacteria bacterium]